MLTKTIVTAALAASLAFGIGLPAHSAQSTSVRSHQLMRSEVDFVAPSPGVFPFRDLPNAIFRLPHPTDRAGTLEEAWAANDAGPGRSGEPEQAWGVLQPVQQPARRHQNEGGRGWTPTDSN